MSADTIASSSHLTNQRHKVVVVGAGQAGLALGYHLTRRGVDVLLLEAADRLGISWERRWDSLRLFTPARYDALPGMKFPAPQWTHPGKDDVAAYLADYATAFALPVRTGARVARLDGTAGALTATLTDGQELTAGQVVVATGAFGKPWVPPFAADLPPTTAQVHSHDYRNPDTLAPGTVLVVGGGNSGFQIALELAEAGRAVHLAEGTRSRTAPQRIAGRDLFWWLTVTGAIHADPSSLVGRRLRASDPVIGTQRRALVRAGVTFRPRATTAQHGTVTFADGSSLQPDAVVWATGYRHDDRWITTPDALDANGALISRGSSTPIPGLHTIGRPWQHSRGSALLGYVAHDAAALAAHLARPSIDRPVQPATR